MAAQISPSDETTSCAGRIGRPPRECGGSPWAASVRDTALQVLMNRTVSKCGSTSRKIRGYRPEFEALTALTCRILDVKLKGKLGNRVLTQKRDTLNRRQGTGRCQCEGR